MGLVHEVGHNILGSLNKRLVSGVPFKRGVQTGRKVELTSVGKQLGVKIFVLRLSCFTLLISLPLIFASKVYQHQVLQEGD